MKTKSKKTNKRAVSPTYSRPAFNTMATHHIGVIVTRYGDGPNNDSHTPIGINIHGVTLEDANYYHADQYGEKRYNRWWQSVRESLEAGKASGVADGFMWKFVPEADPDAGVLYELAELRQQPVSTGLRDYAKAQGNPFQADGERFLEIIDTDGDKEVAEVGEIEVEHIPDYVANVLKAKGEA